MAGHNAAFTDLNEAIEHAAKANRGKPAGGSKRHRVYRVCRKGDENVYYVVHNQGQIEAVGFVADRYGLRADPWGRAEEQELRRAQEQERIAREEWLASLSPDGLHEIIRRATRLAKERGAEFKNPLREE